MCFTDVILVFYSEKSLTQCHCVHCKFLESDMGLCDERQQNVGCAY